MTKPIAHYSPIVRAGDLLDGADLVFTAGTAPTAWGTDPADEPPSWSTAP